MTAGMDYCGADGPCKQMRNAQEQGIVNHNHKHGWHINGRNQTQTMLLEIAHCPWCGWPLPKKYT